MLNIECEKTPNYKIATNSICALSIELSLKTILAICGHTEKCLKDSGHSLVDLMKKIGEYKIITIKNVQDGFIDYDIDNTIDFIPHKMPAWCKLGSSEILMSLTGNTGRIGLTFGEQALLNQRVAKRQPKDKAANPFLYVLLRSDSVQDKIQGLSSGSSQKNLSPIQLSNIYVAYSEEYSDKVSELLAPSVEIIVQKYSENRKLASLRDWLLPMLMNGQVKVKDK